VHGANSQELELARRQQDTNGNTGSMMGLDTTIVSDGGASIEIVHRTGIDPPQSQGSPMSAFSSSSMYTGSHADDDELFLENSAEGWSDVDLERSTAWSYFS
jgi:hypothetical protein